MNIELEEVVVQDVSDDALELAAGGAQGGVRTLELDVCIGPFWHWNSSSPVGTGCHFDPFGGNFGLVTRI